MLNGKTLYLWKIKDVLGGDPGAIAASAKEMGLKAVLVKAADGEFAYNLRLTALGYRDDVMQPFVDALRGVGIAVWGWHYIYGHNPASEATIAQKRMDQFGFDGWVIDAESEMKGNGLAARVYTKALRKAWPGVPIGLTSYRYPVLHPELPWKDFVESGVDFHMPQVYWEQSHNPAYQLQRSFAEFQQLNARFGKALPYFPIGAAYKWNGWQPTAQEISAFVDKAKELNLPGYSLWEWGCAIRAGLGGDVLMLPGFETTPDDPGPDAPPSLEDRVAALEVWAHSQGF